MAFKRNSIILKNSQIIYPNFTGVEKKYNPPGRRNFCVVLEDEEMAQRLRDDGWNVKISVPKEEDDSAFCYLPVEARFDNYPPKIQVVLGDAAQFLNENTVGELDNCDISYADVVINPSTRTEPDGTIKRKAYLSKMKIVLKEDIFVTPVSVAARPALETSSNKILTTAVDADDSILDDDNMPF
jgi:hypothetical protein